MSIQKEVWVIGSKNHGADKTIDWLEEFPNLSDPDVLIINMNSLTKEVLSKMGIQKITELNQAIVDKFKTGGTIVFITSPTIASSDGLYNYWICPIHLNVKTVPEGKRLKYNVMKNPFRQYLEQVGSFSFYLDNFNTEELKNKTGYTFLSSVMSKSDNVVMDNSGHTIGTSYGIYVNKLITENNQSQFIGDITFLPPTNKISITDGVDILLQLYGKETSQEPVPEWIGKIKINGLEKFISELVSLQKKKNTKASSKKTPSHLRRLKKQ